jgi:hypothetical protein
MPDESKEIGFIGIDDKGYPTVREPIKISLSSFKNAKYLDIRKYYDKDGEWHPTTKGITVSGDSFDELLDMLTKHKDEINTWIKEKKQTE